MGGENVERLAQQHAYFLKALARLQEALAEPESSFVRDAIVKRFEMAFGLAWEILLALASREGVLGEVDAANAPHPSRGPQRDAALFRLSSCAQAQLEPQPSAPKGRGRPVAPALLPLPLGLCMYTSFDSTQRLFGAGFNSLAPLGERVGVRG